MDADTPDSLAIIPCIRTDCCDLHPVARVSRNVVSYSYVSDLADRTDSRRLVLRGQQHRVGCLIALECGVSCAVILTLPDLLCNIAFPENTDAVLELAAILNFDETPVASNTILHTTLHTR